MSPAKIEVKNADKNADRSAARAMQTVAASVQSAVAVVAAQSGQLECLTALKASAHRMEQVRTKVMAARSEVQRTAQTPAKPGRSVRVTGMDVSAARAVNVVISVVISAVIKVAIKAAVSGRTQPQTHNRHWMASATTQQAAKTLPTARLAVRLKGRRPHGRRSAPPCGLTSLTQPTRQLRRWLHPQRYTPRHPKRHTLRQWRL